jgi:hypothetical protein
MHAYKILPMQSWRQHKTNGMRATTDQGQDGERGSAHGEGLCSHEFLPRKGEALALACVSACSCECVHGHARVG